MSFFSDALLTKYPRLYTLHLLVVRNPYTQQSHCSRYGIRESDTCKALIYQHCYRHTTDTHGRDWIPVALTRWSIGVFRYSTHTGEHGCGGPMDASEFDSRSPLHANFPDYGEELTIE